MFTNDEKREIQELIEKAIQKENRITKKEIMQEKDTAKRQRLIAENMDLFTNSKEK